MTSDQMAELTKLRRKLEQCWDRKTTHPDWKKSWTETNPSVGQCYITALIVQDIFGGELLFTIKGLSHQRESGKRAGDVFGSSHIWNRLPDGTEIDLTSDQYDGIVPAKVQGLFGKPTTIGAKRSNPRYKLLKRRLEALAP